MKIPLMKKILSQRNFYKAEDRTEKYLFVKMISEDAFWVGFVCPK